MKKTFRFLFAAILLFAWCGLIAQEQTASNGPVPNNFKAERYADYSGNGTLDATIAYGHSSIQNGTVSMPIPAGTPLTFLQAWAAPNFASSMVKGIDGNYYMTEISPALYQVSTTGTVTLLGNITGMGADQPNGIAYNPANNTYYIASSANLFSFDVSTRVATLIGPFNVAGGLMIDLCFDASGTCYAYDLGVDNAYIINIATGNATLLGPLGYDANFGQGMHYDYETNTIYLSAFNNGTFTGQLRTMDPNTGATTMIVDWGFDQVAPFALDTQYGPPCGVGAASNPSPANGAQNLPITGNTLSWTNGAGTVSNEVWFNGVMVYDGAAITSYSLAPQEPLNYFTTYSWKIVTKDATCATQGPTWTFKTMQDPNLGNLFCDDFEAGAGNWTITNDGGTCVWQTLLLASRPYTMPATASGNGFVADADLCGSGTTLLSTATITQSFNLSGYNNVYVEFDNDWRTIAASDEAHVEVSTDGGSTWTGIWDQVGVSVRNTHEMVSAPMADGQANVKFRLRSVQPGWDWWWAVDNFCIYGSIVPVELTSFVANVNQGNVVLSWSTATETNNQGFQIERSNGGEFQAVGFVEGHGTTTETNNYSFTDRNLPAGNYSYRLKQVDFDGTFEYSQVVEVEVVTPTEFALQQNYPNPFNPSTRISFSLATDSKVSLKVFDVLGQEVMTLINNDLSAGTHQIDFNASRLNSGVYFYKIEASGNNGTNFTDVKKMILTK